MADSTNEAAAVEAALNAQPFADQNNAGRVYQFMDELLSPGETRTVIRAAIAAHAAALAGEADD